MNELFSIILEKEWPKPVSKKAQSYLDKFFDREIIKNRIQAKVQGNHGTYRLSFEFNDAKVTAICSCYVGKWGGCHHCEALAHTYVSKPKTFPVKEFIGKKEVKNLDDLPAYLPGVSLEDLLAELKAKGISQKAFAEGIGMTSRHLSTVKSSELKNRYFHELGATKLACLWVLEHLKSAPKKKPAKKKSAIKKPISKKSSLATSE